MRLLYHTDLNDPPARGKHHASGDWQTSRNRNNLKREETR